MFSKRILVFGNAGSGKSTLASRIGNKLGLPVFHLDKYYWQPGWIERPIEEMIADVESILRDNESWVIDGNYKRSLLEQRIQRSDLIVLLDFNRFVCLYRVFKRILKHLRKTRPDMKEGCPERFSWEFIKFVWNYKKRTLSHLAPLLDKYPEKRIVKLRSENEVDGFVSRLVA